VAALSRSGRPGASSRRGRACRPFPTRRGSPLAAREQDHDPLLGPNPRGFRLPVRSVRLHAGAGFVTAVTGEMQLMPGLPAHPRAEAIDVDADGRVVGLR